MKKNSSDSEYNRSFFETVPPIKLTECHHLNMHLESWGLLSDYVLESVKINRYEPNQVSSAAILQVADISGQISCVVKGKTIGLLFGLSAEEWSDIEDMCDCGQQLFYRYFKNGLSTNFSCAQKLFYSFCQSNQREDVLIAIFCRTINMRAKDKDNTLISIKQLQKPTSFALDIYINQVRKTQSHNMEPRNDSL